ncbi:MAG: DUF2309 domain-containing protein [Legionella sp.]
MTTVKAYPEQRASKKFTNTCLQAKNQDLQIQAMLHNAAKRIAPVWPIDTFIACNPLQGFESSHFEDALRLGYVKQQGQIYSLGLKEVNYQMIKWCTSFFDTEESSFTMPYADKSIYFRFLKLAPHDRQLLKNTNARQFLERLPSSAEDAIALCLSMLQVLPGQEEPFIEQTLAYLPGWSGFVKWKAEWDNSVTHSDNRVTIAEFVAIRLILTCILWPDAAKEKKYTQDASDVKNIMTLLEHKETSYKETLLNAILPEIKHRELNSIRRHAQLVFCIDVRSEPYRRAIESMGNYETFGFAGFFGLPIRVEELGANKSKACCPVLLKPKYSIQETIATSDTAVVKRYSQGRAIKNTVKYFYQKLKYNFSTPFILVEALGFFYGLLMSLKSISPTFSSRLSATMNGWLLPSTPTKLNYELSKINVDQGLSLNEQISYAETVLCLMGLTSGFAKLVVLCGHGSTTENNPYASALDCGACGGNHGGINARLLASILNKPEVRQGLEDVGIHIPLDTVFYGALHNTTTDAVKLFTHDGQQSIYRELLLQLESDLEKATAVTNHERGATFNSENPLKEVIKRSLDWSETRPEWGLARNAAFIVAPRNLTKNINLDGRCFLHSYRYEQDPDGTLLETILTAPMVVAQWINTQYLFSTLNNIAFGSGSKITHNVVGKIGIMQGNSSDLMHGLPLQSVMSSDEQRYHEPQRLLTIIYGSKETIHKVIQKHSILKTLVFNQWVHVLVIDCLDQIPYQMNQSGEWVAVA